jgi:DNA-directed RNA polymerase specialized sigma24 family protein
LEQLVARGSVARDELITFTRPFLTRLARQVLAGLRETGVIDVDDLVQEAWPSVLRLIDQFASPRRPPVTWAAAVRRNVLRDLGRVEHKLAGVSHRVWQIRRWLDCHPEVTDPGQVVRIMSIERELLRPRDRVSGAKSRDATQDRECSPTSFVSERLVRRAWRIPSTLPLDVLVDWEVA